MGGDRLGSGARASSPFAPPHALHLPLSPPPEPAGRPGRPPRVATLEGQKVGPPYCRPPGGAVRRPQDSARRHARARRRRAVGGRGGGPVPGRPPGHPGRREPGIRLGLGGRGGGGAWHWLCLPACRTHPPQPTPPPPTCPPYPAQGAYVSPRCLNLTLQYLNHALPHAGPWKRLKPHVPGLLAAAVLPAACFSDVRGREGRGKGLAEVGLACGRSRPVEKRRAGRAECPPAVSHTPACPLHPFSRTPSCGRKTPTST